MIPIFPAAGYAGDAPPFPAVADNADEIEVTTGAAPPAQPFDEGEDAVKVVVRVRPPLERELNGFRPYSPATEVDPSHHEITLSENLRAAANNGIENGVVYNTYQFAFDRVYGTDTPQHTIYDESARGAVGNVLQGYNASIIAFGQTGAGKTHTMTGNLVGEGRGIIPRAVDDVFSNIHRDTGERCKFLVRASYLQIYNEVISDLLKPESTNLNIREDRRRGVHVDGLSEWVVRSPADVYALMERGAVARATGATKLNELSSRSHAIFILIVEKSSLEVADGVENVPAEAMAAAMGPDGGSNVTARLRQTVRVGKLNLVDLAGSERVHLTGAKGKRLEESKKINQSLSALGNVIAALTDPKGRDGRPHIPYRDSKLTRILEDSLGGNCKTTFMAMISPATEAFAESLSTLKFAHRAKRVRNAPRVNEDVDHRTLLRKYERELRRLRAELQQRSADLVDKRLVLQLEEARRREQADKIAAITALERQSAEIARQKSAMAALQGRIASMQSQLLVGGQGLEDTPAFRTLLEREQNRIRGEYDARLTELEAERRTLAEDRAAAERLKALLVKQRDVMVALTQRLSERDAEVLALQAAMEAAESRAKEAEDTVDAKTAELISVRKSVVVGAEGMRTPGGLPNGFSAAAPGAMSVTEQEQYSENINATALRHEISRGGGGSGWTISASPGGQHSNTRGGGPATQSPPSAAGPQEVPGDLSSGGSDDDGSVEVPIGTNGTAERIPPFEKAASAAAAAAATMNKKASLQIQAKEALGVVAADGHDPLRLGAERDALRTILQDKVLTMVGEVGRSVDELGDQATSHPKLVKQLEYLKKLVSATVTAMEAPPG